MHVERNQNGKQIEKQKTIASRVNQVYFKETLHTAIQGFWQDMISIMHLSWQEMQLFLSPQRFRVKIVLFVWRIV